MTALRAFATALVWWAVLSAVHSSGSTAADLAVAAVVAGALGGSAVHGALLASALVLVHGAEQSSRWAAVMRALDGRGASGLGDQLLAAAPVLVSVALGTAAGAAARRASAGAAGIRARVPPPERAGWLAGLVKSRPDLALRVRLLRKDWAGAARLAEAIGMPRSAQRWWRAAGDPEQALRVAETMGRAGLELAEERSRSAPHAQPSPQLELGDPRAARFTIDPPDDDS